MMIAITWRRRIPWGMGLLAAIGVVLLAGCEMGGPAATPVPSATPRVLVATYTPLPKITLAPPTPPAPPTATIAPAAPTALPALPPTVAPTRTNTPKPPPTRTPAPPPTPTTPPFMYMPDGPTRHESNPSFTEIRRVVRAADGTPLDGVIVMLDTGGLKIPLPTGQRPGYYSWVWCDWARDGTFTLYVLGPDGQPASPFITVQTFSKDLMAIAIQDWKRSW